MADLRPDDVRRADAPPTPGLRDRLLEVPGVRTLVHMQDRYKDDDADQHAAALGFFGFVSLFPILLLALSVAGFALAGDPAAQARFADRLVEAIPGFQGAFGQGDSAVQQAIQGLSDNAGGLGLLAVASLLFTGLKVINSAHRATLAVFHVDVIQSGVKARVRQIGTLALLGFLAMLGVAASGLVGAASTLATEQVSNDAQFVNDAAQLVATLAGLLGSVLADFALFLVAYKLLSFGRGPRFVHLWPGALLAAVGWTALKAFGATYVTGQIAKTNASVGALGGVIGLLLLLYLAGRVYVYGAELTSVVRNPGEDLASRYAEVQYEGEDDDVLGSAAMARKATLRARLEGTPRPRAARPEPRPERPRTPAPSAAMHSPTISPATTDRLRQLDLDRRARQAAGLGGPTGLGGTPGELQGRVVAGRTHDGKPDVRGAAALVLGAGAVAGLLSAAKPWKPRNTKKGKGR